MARKTPPAKQPQKAIQSSRQRDGRFVAMSLTGMRESKSVRQNRTNRQTIFKTNTFIVERFGRIDRRPNAREEGGVGKVPHVCLLDVITRVCQLFRLVGG